MILAGFNAPCTSGVRNNQAAIRQNSFLSATSDALPPVAHACEKIAEKHPLRPLCQYHIDIMKVLRRIEQQHLPTPEQIFGEVRRTHLLQVSGPLPRLHIPAFIIFQRKSQLIRTAVPPHPENGNRAAAVQAVMRLPVFTFKVNPFQRFEASLGIGEGFEQLID